MKKPYTLLALVVLVSACANSHIQTEIEPPPFQETEVRSLETDGNGSETMLQIRSRNNDLEDDHRWITKAYKKLMIKNLNRIPDHEFGEYARYLDNGSVYIVVHPAYYVFFQNETIPDGIHFRDNAVELFLDTPAFSPVLNVLKHQEKRMRDFLEYMSTEKKLVILILPGKYKKWKRYLYKNDQNEYVRYLNEVTNGSESVVYLYSRRPYSGTLSNKKMKILLNFLSTIGARDIRIGGGYFGRCLAGFQIRMEKNTKREIYIVPELIQLSPEDMGFLLARKLLNSDGTLNLPLLTEVLQEKIEGEGYKDFSGFRNLGTVAQ